MSKFVPVEGVSKRPKRASRACDHCRWKRLKCSDEQKEQSCMNCVIYGVKCQYTPPYSPGGTRKKGESSTGRPNSGGQKKRPSTTATKERSSQSPGLLEGGQDSPTSSYADDVVFSAQAGGRMMPKFANAKRLATEYAKSTNPGIDMDQLSQRLDQYAAFLTGFSEDHNSPAEILSEETGLPPQPIVTALLQAYQEGFQAGHIAVSRNWKPPHLASNTRRSRSMHEFTPSPTAEHAMSPMTLDHMSAAAHHLASGPNSPHASSPHPHHAGLGFGDPSGAMAGLGIEASHHDYAMPVHHGHPQAVPSNVRGALGDDRSHAPRSVPHGLTLAIPGAQQWPGTPNSSPAVSGAMQLPPGYGQNQGHGGFY